MIIGISGRRGSGKDIIAKIFQYFTLPKTVRTIPMQEWVTELSYHEEIPGLSKYIEIRKYADKLKECASLLLGIPRWQFELEEVKEQVLPECWNRWVLTTEFDQTIHATKQDALNIVKVLKLSKAEYSLHLQPITVRLFLQWMGTEAMREQIHPDTWVNALFSEYQIVDTLNVAALIDDNKPIIQTPIYPNWIVTDVRFPNEVKAIANGLPGYPIDEKYDFRYTIRVERPELLRQQISDEHESETALDDYEDWDEVIINDCSLEELGFKVHTILKSNPRFQKYFHI